MITELLRYSQVSALRLLYHYGSVGTRAMFSLRLDCKSGRDH